MKKYLILLLCFSSLLGVAQTPIARVKQGESFTFTLNFPSNYDTSRIAKLTAFLGGAEVGDLGKSTITPLNDSCFRLQLRSSRTALLKGDYAFQVAVEDEIIGVKKTTPVLISFTTSNNTTSSAAVNSGSDVLLKVNILTPGVVANAELANVYRGYSNYDIAKKNGYTGTEQQWINSVDSARIVTQVYRDSSLSYRNAAYSYMQQSQVYRDSSLSYRNTTQSYTNLAKTYADSALSYRNAALLHRNTAQVYRDSALSYRNASYDYSVLSEVSRLEADTSKTQAEAAATQAAASAASASNIVLGVSTSRPSVRPTLLFDFANTKALDPRITFTRNSIATYFDETGTMRTAIANQPRFDHDPVTGESLGLLIEQTRTNLISNSQMVGAILGTIGAGGSPPSGWPSEQNLGGGLNLIVDALPIERGMQCIDVRYTGTPVNINPGLFRANLVTATAGNVYTLSFYAKSVLSGFASFSTEVHFLDASSVAIGGATITTHTLTGNLIRYSVVLPTSPASTAFIRIRFRAAGTVGVALDASYRLACPQLELGTVATSYIPTTSTSATRGTETGTIISGLRFSQAFNPVQGSFFVEFRSLAAGGTPRVLTHNNVTNDIIVGISGSDVLVTGPGTFGNTAFSGVTTTNFNRVATAIDGVGTRAALNGTLSLASIGSVSGTKYPAATELKIANQTGGSVFSGHIRRIAYYPVALTNSELQALTSTGLLSGKSPNQLPTTGDLGELATLDVKGMQRIKVRSELSYNGTGASVSYTIRRPYPFTLAVINSNGATTVTLPSANADGTYTENTNYTLVYNGPVGNTLTLEIIPLIP